MRKKVFLIILSIFLFIIPNKPGLIQDFTPEIKSSDLNEKVELTADADLFTQVRKGTDIDVYAGGATPFLRLGLWDNTYDLGGYLSEIYIRFSLPKIENITSMILKLSYWDGYPNQQDLYYDINASLVSNNWVESNGVWTERPAYLGTSTIIYLHNPTYESDVYINLTSLSGISDTTITIHLCPNNLFRIRYPDPFLTSENSATPRLIVEYLGDVEDFGVEENFNIIVIMIGVTFLGLGVYLAIIFVIKIKAIKSIRSDFISFL